MVNDKVSRKGKKVHPKGSVKNGGVKMNSMEATAVIFFYIFINN